jgi:uncharacterized damage-inducible protein DinB
MVKTDSNVLKKTLGDALSGKGSHVEAGKAFEGLDWKIAGERPGGAPHSIYQLLNHIVYWQEWGVKWLDGKKPPVPRHASGSWPGAPGPANSAEWKQAVRRLDKAVDALTLRCAEGDLLSKRGGKSRMEMIQVIASHSSYHIGQAVLLRQTLGAWPPPSGGVTW